MTARFALSSRLDAADLAAQFARKGRVQVRGLLADDAAAWLHSDLRERQDWRQVINSGPDKLVELDRATQAGLTRQQREQLDEAVHSGAREGFQYRYESIRVPDGAAERAASEDPLAAFAAWMSGGEMRDFLREVTGAPEIGFADAQATAYSPGDFLTGHDDDVAGKNRVAAYVMNLTPQWRTEWGGLLLFHDDQAGTVEGLVPAFNTLNLFRVPQQHSVSQVTRAAAYRRYAITGWLRRASPE